MTVSNAQVDDAFLQIARNINVSQDKLVQHAAAGRHQHGYAQGSPARRHRLERGDRAGHHAAGADFRSRTRPAGRRPRCRRTRASTTFSRKSSSSARARAAAPARPTAIAPSLPAATRAVDLSLAYTDAAVIDVGRRHATQLPEAIAKELAGLNVGGITKPRVVESGVSMLAVCEKTQAEDLTFIKGDLRAEAGNSALEGQVTSYLDEPAQAAPRSSTTRPDRARRGGPSTVHRRGPRWTSRWPSAWANPPGLAPTSCWHSMPGVPNSACRRSACSAMRRFLRARALRLGLTLDIADVGAEGANAVFAHALPVAQVEGLVPDHPGQVSPVSASVVIARDRRGRSRRR